MSAQEQGKKRSTDQQSDTNKDSSTVDQEHKDKLDADVDDILDEIDSVLEENAEEFVRGYVQKGGQ